MITKASQLFLERHGIIPTRRGPTSRMAPGALQIHLTPVAAPLPHPDFVFQANAADRPLTTEPWPHGS